MFDENLFFAARNRRRSRAPDESPLERSVAQSGARLRSSNSRMTRSSVCSTLEASMHRLGIIGCCGDRR